MAEKSIVSNSKLIAIADAIRGKTGKSDKISLDNMPIEIEGIQSGSDGVGTFKKYFDTTKSAKYFFYSRDNLSSLDEFINYNDTENVTTTEYMFYNCKNLIKAPQINTSNTTNMRNMFYTCTNLTEAPQLNTSKVTNASNMFYGCSNLTDVPSYDFSSISERADTGETGITCLFQYCRKLQKAPFLNINNAQSMSRMFCGCTSLIEIPLYDTSNVTNMYGLFEDCTSLTTIPKLNTSKVTNMQYMFSGCTSLTEVPALDYSKASGFNGFIRGCTLLTELPEMPAKLGSVQNMCANCTNLVTVHGLNMINVTYFYNTFQNCTNLTNLTLYNIRVNLQIGSGTSWGTFLTKESLIHTCKECIKNSSASYTLTISTASKEILDSVYVKFVDPSIIEIATNEKGEVVECESTDEGAMTIAAYMALKRWTIGV